MENKIKFKFTLKCNFSSTSHSLRNLILLDTFFLDFSSDSQLFFVLSCSFFRTLSFLFLGSRYLSIKSCSNATSLCGLAYTWLHATSNFLSFILFYPHDSSTTTTAGSVHHCRKTFAFILFVLAFCLSALVLFNVK
jgi:hypothetical protein